MIKLRKSINRRGLLAAAHALGTAAVAYVVGACRASRSSELLADEPMNARYRATVEKLGIGDAPKAIGVEWDVYGFVPCPASDWGDVLF